MKIVSFNCPNCGAAIDISDGKTHAFCEHCGAKLLVDDEAVHVKYDNAEQAGYEFEKGRQRAQAEANKNRVNTPIYQTTQPGQTYTPPKKKRKTWLWVLGWIFFFPIPLTILIWRSNWKPAVKYAVIAFLWIFVFMVGKNGSNSDTTDTSNKESDVVEEVTNEVPTKESAEVSSESTVEEVAVNPKEKLDEYFREYSERGSYDNAKGIAEELGLFTNSTFVNNGVGHRIKIGASKDDVSGWGVDDIYKGDLYIVISENDKMMEYIKTNDDLEISYTEGSGYKIYDKNRLSAFDGGKTKLEVESADEALSYVPELETEISPIEQFYEELEWGMSKGEVEDLIKKYGLTRSEGRSNSFSWYVYIGDEPSATCVYYCVEKSLNQIDFHDYYVENNYDLYIKCDNDEYNIGDKKYNSATEAVEALHAYRVNPEEAAAAYNEPASAVEVIYEQNEDVNAYILAYNEANPDGPITSDMLFPFTTHSGKVVDSEARAYLDGFEVIIRGNKEVYIGYTPNVPKTSDDYKEMFKKFVRGFGFGLSDDVLEDNWNTAMENHRVEFDDYKIDISGTGESVTYMTITKVKK